MAACCSQARNVRDKGTVIIHSLAAPPAAVRDISARQVSWLAALVAGAAFPDQHDPVAFGADSLLTVAGAAMDRLPYHVPFSPSRGKDRASNVFPSLPRPCQIAGHATLLPVQDFGNRCGMSEAG